MLTCSGTLDLHREITFSLRKEITITFLLRKKEKKQSTYFYKWQ